MGGGRKSSPNGSIRVENLAGQDNFLRLCHADETRPARCAPPRTKSSAQILEVKVAHTRAFTDQPEVTRKGQLRGASGADTVDDCDGGSQQFVDQISDRDPLLSASAETLVTFARLRSGSVFPAHTHLGDEHYLVLQGSCVEPEGVVTGPGEIALRPAGSAHSLEAAGPNDLIMAVVLEVGIELAHEPDSA